MKDHWFGRWIEIKLLVGLLSVSFGENEERKIIGKCHRRRENHSQFSVTAVSIAALCYSCPYRRCAFVVLLPVKLLLVHVGVRQETVMLQSCLHHPCICVSLGFWITRLQLLLFVFMSDWYFRVMESIFYRKFLSQILWNLKFLY